MSAQVYSVVVNWAHGSPVVESVDSNLLERRTRELSVPDLSALIEVSQLIPEFISDERDITRPYPTTADEHLCAIRHLMQENMSDRPTVIEAINHLQGQ